MLQCLEKHLSCSFIPLAPCAAAVGVKLPCEEVKSLVAVLFVPVWVLGCAGSRSLSCFWFCAAAISHIERTNTVFSCGSLSGLTHGTATQAALLAEGDNRGTWGGWELLKLPLDTCFVKLHFKTLHLHTEITWAITICSARNQLKQATAFYPKWEMIPSPSEAERNLVWFILYALK